MYPSLIDFISLLGPAMVSKKQSQFVNHGPKPEGIGSLIPTVCLAVIFALVSSWFQMRIVDLEKSNNSRQIAQTIQVFKPTYYIAY